MERDIPLHLFILESGTISIGSSKAFVKTGDNTNRTFAWLSDIPTIPEVKNLNVESVSFPTMANAGQAYDVVAPVEDWLFVITRITAQSRPSGSSIYSCNSAFIVPNTGSFYQSYLNTPYLTNTNYSSPQLGNFVLYVDYWGTQLSLTRYSAGTLYRCLANAYVYYLS